MYDLEQWCNNNNAKQILNYWDYELNEVLPSEIFYYDKTPRWFKCKNPDHQPFQLRIDVLCNKNRDYTKYIFCKQCNSIGQWFIDNYGKEFLEQKWSDKNNQSPLMIPRGRNNAKIWLRCTENNNHPDYDLTPNNAIKNAWGCPYCSHKTGKVLSNESLGVYYPQVVDIWSNKNKKTPFEYSPKSNQKVWWKCENGIHEDYELSIANQVDYNKFSCTKCRSVDKHIYSIYMDLSNQKFGNLTALYQDENNRYWHCKCDCGTEDYLVDGYKLIIGHTKSCGCQHHLFGEESANWRGGSTPELKRIRNSNQYQEWREFVFKRDDYTCQCCGKRGVTLNAHHIESFADNEDLRFDVNNGITLCEECHAIEHPGSFHDLYGAYHNTREQLEEYLQNHKLKSA